MKNDKDFYDYFNNEVKKHVHIVLCNEHYNPLGIIRSLGESGIRPVAIIIRKGKKFVEKSKYISKAIFANNINDAMYILTKEFSGLELKPFLYVTDDFFLEYVDNQYDQLKESFIFTNAGTNGAITKYLNKDNINCLARENGFSIPKSEVVKKGELPKELRYPIITKSIASTSGAWKNDSFICNSEEELLEAYKKIKGKVMLLQEYIEREAEFNIDGISVSKGKEVFLSMLTQYVYLVPGRYSYYMDVKNVPEDDLSKKLKTMIAQIGYEGIFDGEFMLGKDGIVYFLEINFRPNAFNYASTCAGMNDAYLWAKGMLSGSIDDNCYKTIPDGFRAMIEDIDFKDRVLTKQVSIIKWLKDFVSCGCHFYFNMHDIVPFISAFIFKKKW